MFLLCTFFFYNATATTEIYTLSLHDALPICSVIDSDYKSSFEPLRNLGQPILNFKIDLDNLCRRELKRILVTKLDRKSTRLNSSHGYISYAVFCLKKKKKK